MEEQQNQKQIGRVIKYNGKYGFIKTQYRDIFFHSSGIVSFAKLKKGDNVEFQIEPSLKKEGTLQAINIKYTSQNEVEINIKPNLIGILKWFDENKKFGLISTTPEKQSYLLHLSNYVGDSTKIYSRKVLVFSEGVERNTKIAKNCREASNYEDWELAMCYLNQPDNIILGDVYSCGLKFAASQEIFSKNRTQIFDFISRYFDEKVRDSPIENHLIYFRFLEELFNSYWLSSKDKIVLVQFFSKYSSYLKPLPDYSYCLLLENYITYLDFEVLEQKLNDDKIEYSSSQFKKIFKIITNIDLYKKCFEIYLNKLDNIDSIEKFNNIEEILEIPNINNEIRCEIINSIFDKSSKYIQFLLWRQNYTQKKDLFLIGKYLHVMHDRYSIYFSYYDIFSKLKDEKEQRIVISEFLRYLTEDDFEKFDKAQKILNSTIITFKIRKDFLISFINLCPINERYKIFNYFDNELLTKLLLNLNLKDLKEALIYIKLNIPKFNYYNKRINDRKLVLLEILAKFLNDYLKNESDIIDQPIENIFNEKCKIEIKLKLWINDLIIEFDFNSYCFYYFTLNPEERKIFSRKAKAIMKEDLKTSMLKKKEPWQFIEKLEEEGEIVSVFSASWKSIWYGDKTIRICIDSLPSFTQPYYWEFSEEKFNLLYDYISGKRLKDLKIYVSNYRVNKIEGLDDLEEIIWKVQIQKEIETGVNGISKGIGTNKIPTNMILRNQCIQLLNKLQLREFEPTRILEKTLNVIKGGLSIDISLLYSIPINENEIAIIWESLELEKSKATHLFKCLRSEYENILFEIENYLSSKLKVRSSLYNNEDIEQNKKLHYLCRIDHDNFNFSKWENSLYEILPELKDNLN